MANLIELKNMQNNLFFIPDLIFSRVARTYKVKISEYNLGDFINWCAEMEQEILVDVEALIRVKGLQLGFPMEDGTLTIQNGMVPVPPFTYRISLIFDEYNNVIQKAGYNGSYIILPSDFTSQNVFIDSYMIPFDPETMKPLLLKGHEQAAYSYCVYKMFEEDIALQKVAFNVGERIRANYEQSLAEAGSSVLRTLTADDYIRYVNTFSDLLPDMKDIFKTY